MPTHIIKRLAYAHIDGMKDLWCSSTNRLLSTDMKLWGEGSLVRFGCYQHRRDYLWCSSTVRLLSMQT